MAFWPPRRSPTSVRVRFGCPALWRIRAGAIFGVDTRIGPQRFGSAGAAQMSLIAELTRRNVFRVGAAYAIVAWLLVEVASVVLPNLYQLSSEK